MKLICKDCGEKKDQLPTPDGDEICPYCWGEEFEEEEEVIKNIKK